MQSLIFASLKSLYLRVVCLVGWLSVVNRAMRKKNPLSEYLVLLSCHNHGYPALDLGHCCSAQVFSARCVHLTRRRFL